jgi:hypothetical protein
VLLTFIYGITFTSKVIRHTSIMTSECLNHWPVLHLEEFLLRPTSRLFVMCGIRPTLFAIVMRTDARDDKNFLLRLSILVKYVKVCTLVKRSLDC